MMDPYVSKVQSALLTVLTICGPVLLVAVAVGLTIGLLQALTQIQDQTLPQAVKLLVILVMLVLLGSTFGREVAKHASSALDEFPFMRR
jgi:type III secretion protein S